MLSLKLMEHAALARVRASGRRHVLTTLKSKVVDLTHLQAQPSKLAHGLNYGYTTPPQRSMPPHKTAVNRM